MVFVIILVGVTFMGMEPNKNPVAGCPVCGPRGQHPMEMFLCDPVPPGKRVQQQNAITTQSAQLANRGA